MHDRAKLPIGLRESIIGVAPHAKVMPIPIKDHWTSTGIYLHSSDSVTVIMNGIACTSYPNIVGNNNAMDSWVGPEGSPGLLNGLINHGMIGKIGISGTPFNVGRAIHFRSNRTDTLFLGYNDDNFSDNYGYYVAYITRFPGLLTAVQDPDGGSPAVMALMQNYPNPFNPSTTIEYQIAKKGNIEVSIYDLNGRLVKTVQNGLQYPGSYSLSWDGKSENGGTVSSGMYFYQVKSEGIQLVRKMMMVK
jgi:hypothetical protein